jgi:regulator of nucleoside diphosphate kinase
LQLLEQAAGRKIPRTPCEETEMRNRQVVVTQRDAARLRALLASYARSARDDGHLDELGLEIERALVLEPGQVPRDVVTMHARVRVLDLATAERRDLVLVYPAESDIAANRVSVLAPLGTALLGYREGDEVEWQMPGGLRRLRIESVVQEGEETSCVYSAQPISRRSASLR